MNKAKEWIMNRNQRLALKSNLKNLKSKLSKDEIAIKVLKRSQKSSNAVFHP